VASLRRGGGRRGKNVEQVVEQTWNRIEANRVKHRVSGYS